MPNSYTWAGIRNIGELERKEEKVCSYRDASKSQGWDAGRRMEEEREGGRSESEPWLIQCQRNNFIRPTFFYLALTPY